MKWMVGLIMAAAFAGCDEQTNKGPELQENTEEYFKAHGIVQGQPNELRIGGTLFRFPAGVGLNPHSAQGAYRSTDGSPMTLSTKEGLEQGKYEEVATPIAKGRADKVTFYLDPERGYAPNPSPFGGGIRVVITKWNGQNKNRQEFVKRMQGRAVVEHPHLNLKEYLPSSTKGRSGSTYESTRSDIREPDGGHPVFSCQETTPQKDSGPAGLCITSYVNTRGGFIVSIYMQNQVFLNKWQEAYPAVTRFVDSVAAK